ncbi:KEOPS complex component [Halobacteriales archaeon QS_4_69_31]|nr:MAG: KEOPS complex component [Halobacteriales archaeon QS_4_69_31]
MELLECVVTVEDVDAFVERLGAIGDDHGVTVQAFDARYVVDRTHLARAVELADRAIARGENVARDRAVEVLCYAAGRRQIDRALEMGVSAGERPAVVLVDAPGTGSTDATAAERAAVEAVESTPALRPVETLGEFDPGRVRAFFDVSEAELATVDGDLAALVHERVALLDVEK